MLDVAAGGGRHARLFLARGHAVVAVDRDVSRLRALAADPQLRDARLRIVEADLEGGPWPLGTERFAGVVVTHYLWRPLFAHLAAAVAPGGVLIYETFMRGQERLGKPRNPAFLLEPDELRRAFAGELEVIAFEQGEVAEPRAAVLQRICAVRVKTVSDSVRTFPAAVPRKT